MAIPTNIGFHASDSRCSLLQIIVLFYIFVVPAFIITLPGQICNAQTPVPPCMCNGHNYTKGSKFESNLNTVLNNLVQHTSQTGFNISVYGQSPDQIYGLLQCDGDATAQQCYNCSQKAIAALRQVCGNAIGGRVWLQVCYLRYENGNFIGRLDYTSVKYRYIQQNVSSPGVFTAALKRLLNNLSGEATSRSGLYASGSITDSLSRNIYSTVQCWKDISSDDCTRCLSSTINDIVTTYAGCEGVEAYLGSCKVRYERYSFFDSPAPSASPVEAPANKVPISGPPSSNSTQMNQSEKPSNKIRAIIGLAAGLLFVLFV